MIWTKYDAQDAGGRNAVWITNPTDVAMAYDITSYLDPDDPIAMTEREYRRWRRAVGADEYSCRRDDDVRCFGHRIVVVPVELAKAYWLDS